MKLIRKPKRSYGKYFAIAALILMAFIAYKNPLDQFYNQNNLPSAKTDSNKTLLIDQNALIAKQLESQGKYKEAIHEYKKILYPDKQIAKIHMNIGSLYLREKRYDDVIRHMNNAMEANPNLIGPHIYIGKAYDKKEMYAQAVKHYQKILDVRPNHFDANLNIGLSFMRMHKYDLSLKHNKIAMKINPGNVHPYLNTGHVYNKTGEMDKAISMYKQAVQLAPNLANAHYNLGYTLRIKGELDSALAALNKAIELNPNYVDAHIARAQTYWSKKDFQLAFEDYEWRWRLFGLDHEKVRAEMWNGSDLTGKRILLYSEQGLGDTVQFIRYAKLVKERGATVICKVQKPLLDLLKPCPFIDELVTDFNESKYDVRAALLSLPRIFKTRAEDIPAEIPYLQASPQFVDLWKKRIAQDKNFKVGLCWHVDPKHEKIKCPSSMRSLTLKEFEPLAQLDGISFYSLQKLNGLDQLKNKPKKLNIKTFGDDFDESHGRFMDTAALIQNLDLVITVDTSIAHIAGALGKPVWMLMPFSPDCRWYLGCEDTPWYPSARLFRQSKPGKFGPVIQNVADTLQKKLKTKTSLTA